MQTKHMLRPSTLTTYSNMSMRCNQDEPKNTSDEFAECWELPQQTSSENYAEQAPFTPLRPFSILKQAYALEPA